MTDIPNVDVWGYPISLGGYYAVTFYLVCLLWKQLTSFLVATLSLCNREDKHY